MTSKLIRELPARLRAYADLLIRAEGNPLRDMADEIDEEIAVSKQDPEIEVLRRELDDEKRCRFRACAMLAMPGDDVSLDDHAHALCVDELGTEIAARLFPGEGAHG